MHKRYVQYCYLYFLFIVFCAVDMPGVLTQKVETVLGGILENIRLFSSIKVA